MTVDRANSRVRVGQQQLLSKYRINYVQVLIVLALIPLLWLLLAYFGRDFILVLLPVSAIGVVAYRMHLSRLRQKTRQITEASRIHLATVEAIATAIDARDQVGGGHVRRTQLYAVGIGRIMGLGENDINALRTGALLHDIGKLAVPDHILNKPGSLTAAEFERTKIHSLVGASILEEVGFGYPVVPTVKYHHERWDGLGYPCGLVREEIPLTARILSVADAFDTVCSARPYRPAVASDEARHIIRSEAGSRFDPRIVRVLLENLPSLEDELQAEGLSYGAHVSDEKPCDTNNYVEQIKLANREVFSLYELAREFSSSGSLEKTVAMCAEKIGEFVPFDTYSLYLVDDGKRFATATQVIGLNSELLRSRRIKIGQGATGHALKVGETVYNVDPDLDFSFSEIGLAGQYSAMASVPLVADEKLIGAVTIYSQELVEYGEEHLRLFETISRIAADAIGTSLKHDEAKVHALTDPMTGLPNARSLQLQFDKEIARASRSGTSFQLLMLDLDRFKAVNDSFGHKVGDEMLREVSKVIREQLRDYDFLARYGGDEFVALIPETTREDVIDLCDRIETAVGAFYLTVDNRQASVGVSLGTSGYPEHGETFDQMIVAADKAMYERKASRKGLSSVPNQTERSADQSAPTLPVTPYTLLDNLIVELDETHVINSATVN
ncbi:MAG: diguanylate cyclase [Pyrinomonadaceae bacterium]